jgi:glycosyltransferase involved in cell wall biosynthesis
MNIKETARHSDYVDSRVGTLQQSPIIVHSHLRWDFVWQRPQQILSRLAAFHKILFIEEPVAAEGMARLHIEIPIPNVIRVVPQLMDLCEPFDTQCERVLELIRTAMLSQTGIAGEFTSPIQWFYTPQPAPTFLGEFGATMVVYDCMDELANFRFAPPDIGQRERYLLKHADIVFTGGYQLFQSKSQHHPNVRFYGCGVDVAHFGRARDELTVVPPELASLRKPMLGYFGVIDERIDYDLIARLAGALPHYSVVLVGPLAKVDAGVLPAFPNVYWFGQRAYDDLPSYVKAFDVCMMPFALNAATRYINPTKTLEYMAAGKPIVSTAVPDVVRNFSPIVAIARSPNDFIAAAVTAAESPDFGLIRRGLELAQRSSWADTVERMRNDLLNHSVGN